ncbi:MAG TPA: HIT family protein [Bacillota bacterium]|nr:HIT family protein [Bacillota bacterium]
MKHENCLFCKIIEGEVPSAKVYEDDDVYAFLDISQVTKGHTLVIPKKHTQNIYETPKKVAKKLFAPVPKIANAIKDTYQPAGLNILNNNEIPGDQTVFHLHIHLIPRYDETDGYSTNWVTHRDDYTPEDLQQIAQEISKNLDD